MKYPILCMIGTIHGTIVEHKLFRILNQMKIDWLCEGENDFRKCKSLKNYEIHLVTDTLFVYMVLSDVINLSKKSNMLYNNLYYNELIDRFIELLITISRLTNYDVYYQIIKMVKKMDYNWTSIINTLMYHKLNYEMINDIEKKFKKMKITELIRIIKLFVHTIIRIIYSNNKFRRNIDFRYISTFIKNRGNCELCEDYIFMDVRDNSFCDIINNHDIKNLTVLTVGIDHLTTLHKKLQKKAKYQIIRFKCSTNEDIKKIINYLLNIIDYNNINEYN